MKSRIFPSSYLGLANSLEIDADGYAFIPYGDTRHSGRDGRGEKAGEQPVIQRFDRAAALALVNDFRSAASTVKRAVVGLPIFKGHPDAPRFARIFPDKTPRGTIADMDVTEKGLRFRPVLTPQGSEDVRNGDSDFSPYWYLRKVGEENGTPVVSPFRLLSIGIVPKGNMPGLSLVNAADCDGDDDTSTHTKMKELLLKLLAALKVNVPENADDAALANAVDTALPTLAATNAAETELTALKTDKANLEAKVADLEKAKTTAEGERLALANAKTTLEGDLTSTKEKLATERRERATLLANAAVAEGRLPAAERDATVTALCNAADFAAEVDKLAKRQKSLPVTSTTKTLGDGRGSEKPRSEQILALVNARMDAEKLDYETAFARVQADKANAHLFAAAARK